MARKPIFDRPMTPAERKRRSREAAKNGTQLKHGYIMKECAEYVNMSTRIMHYYDFIMHNSECAEEWKSVIDSHKMGIRTVAEMVRKLPTSEQKDLIKIIKTDGKTVALRVWKEVTNTARGFR